MTEKLNTQTKITFLPAALNRNDFNELSEGREERFTSPINSVSDGDEFRDQ